MIADIGLGNRAVQLVAQRLYSLMQAEKMIAEDQSLDAHNSKRAPLFIEGTEGLLLHFSACCRPIPGDPIVGILKAGKGIVVHVNDCKRIARYLLQSNTYVPLRWSKHVSGDFLVTLGVVIKNERGALAALASAVSDAEANIDDIHVDDREGCNYKVTLKISVKNRVHLAMVLKNLRRAAAVIKITRAK